MTDKPDMIGQAGLQFFGCMSASISHELKNALAIIKENAGLLSDYIHMMGKGMSVEPERFDKIAGRIEAQTHRADAIIKNLNQFAHSVDTPVKSVDLNEILDLLVALHRRPAAMRQVELEPRPAVSPVTVTTNPFVLLNLLGLVLAFSLQTLPGGGVMTLSTGPAQSEAEVGFGDLQNLADVPADQFPGEHINALLTALGATAIIEPEACRIVVRLPMQP
ncbi:MAG: histidine kinase dimerization/phospho-acceptor domain-containing protein [Desulfobacteraceae bacterium]